MTRDIILWAIAGGSLLIVAVLAGITGGTAIGLWHVFWYAVERLPK